MNIGQSITDARKARNISRKELAIRLGIPYTTLRNYETSVREPSLGMLGRIAQALGTTVYEMIGPDWSGIDMSDAWTPIPGDTKSPAPTEGGGTEINPRYYDLSEEARAVVDAMIDQLSKAGQSDD